MIYHFKLPIFWRPKNINNFLAHVDGCIGEMGEHGAFAADNLISFGRNLGFFGDTDFTSAIQAENPDRIESSIVWRTHVACWAAKTAMRKEGDFVECGTYKGYTAAVICRYLSFERTNKNFYLYDMFDPRGGEGEGHRMPQHGEHLYGQVVKRFERYPNVRVIKGKVPLTFSEACPKKISFLHIDMNNAEAELCALNHLFDRVVDGGMIVFDDYGWLAYQQQQVVEDAFVRERGYSIVELPTGQGLLVK